MSAIRPGRTKEPSASTATLLTAINGGRTEYNNWELDGGDNMDNGSNTTLNVYPSLDAIAEFKVLTSNYGAQYGRNGSGTIEVETKSGTRDFHGDVYEFVRNNAFNARPLIFRLAFLHTIRTTTATRSAARSSSQGLYNTDKEKTFFFWSQEWRKESVPGQTFSNTVPSALERTGDFSDLCPNANPPSGSDPMADCPHLPGTTTAYPGNKVPVDPNAQFLLALIPAPNSGTFGYKAAPVLPTDWREELIRVDHNITNNVRGIVPLHS